MVTTAFFLLKVSGCLLIFYILYIVVFKINTFFRVNRGYLLFSLIASFVIPTIEFPISENQYAFYPNSISGSFIEPETSAQIENIASDVRPLSLMPILAAVYFLGALLMFTRCLIFVIQINRLKNDSEIHQLGTLKIVIAKVSQPFSFFNLIFLPLRETNSLIIEHEMVHVRQFHWIDLLVVEVVSIILWFNPLLILYQRAIKLQHEIFGGCKYGWKESFRGGISEMRFESGLYKEFRLPNKSVQF